MTSYNREGLIADAIESVLGSTFKDFEFIIVDDASTDNTVSVIRNYKDVRIKLFINPYNLGDYPNRNKAVSLAAGKFIKFVDSDDVIYPQTLEKMVNAMEQYPSAAFASGDIKQKFTNYPVFYTGREALRVHFLNKGLLLSGPGNSIIRKTSLEAIGLFPLVRYIGDYQAWLQLCMEYDFILLEPGLVSIRNHEGQENDVGRLEYYHLNYNLHKNFLTKEGLPFTTREQKTLLYNYRILLGRRIYQRLLWSFGIKRTWKIIKKCNEGLFIFLVAFFPVKKDLSI